MRLAAKLIAVLVGLVAVIAAVGSALPVAHVASRTIALNRPIDEVWGVLTDFRGQLSWRKDLKTVELVAGTPRETWREDTGVLDQAATIEGVMRGLASHFGEEPRITP